MSSPPQVPDGQVAILQYHAAAIHRLNEVYKQYGVMWLHEEVITVDEADLGHYKPWPVDKAYLTDTWQAIEESNKIAIVKSRRMMISWLVAAYCVWKLRYNQSLFALWQSETEEKADFFVENRCAFIEEHLKTEELRLPLRKLRGKSGLVNNLHWTSTFSQIRGVAQGPTAFLAYTPSIVIMDEAEMQPDAEVALSSALPFAEKGAKLILMSTPHPLGKRGPLAKIAADVGFVRWSG